MRRSGIRTFSAVMIALALTLVGCGAPAGNVPTTVPTTEVPPTATAFPTATNAPLATNTPSAMIPTDTAATSPVTGSILVEGGNSVAGGVSGETIELHVQFEAKSTAGQVTEMRAKGGMLGSCMSEADMQRIVWEPFAAEKVYMTTAFGNFQGWYANVQYRDVAGNVSPVYCDDISIEGMPPAPSP